MKWQRVGGVVAWVAVVAVGAGGSWLAIDRAGGEVSAESGLDLGPVQRARNDSSAPVTPLSSPGSATPGTPRPTLSAAQDPNSDPPSTRDPRPEPTPRDATPATTAPVSTQRRTWSGEAGLVTASCTGSRLRFVSAQPADGWYVERGDDGAVDVRFERGEEQEVRVTARCVAGVPAFSARRDD